jgi:hypothetical protein
MSSGGITGPINPSATFVAIVPHASTTFTRCRSVYVGGAGTVVAISADGTEITFAGVPAGAVLPISTVRIDDTSTATNMVALY